MTDTARIGVVGLGGMGRNHASSIDEQGHAIVAGTDVVPDMREAFAERFDATTYEDHERMYDEASLDGVVITTPNKFHEPAAVAALQRDIAVLCEKPLAHTLESAERIAAAAEASAAFCTVGFHERFRPATQMYRTRYERGTFGEISHVQGSYVRRRGIPGGQGGWFTNPDLSGGGALIDIGVHLIDLALYTADHPEVVEVSGQVRTELGGDDDYVHAGSGVGGPIPEGGIVVADSASAFLRCADGTTLSLEVAWASNQAPKQELIVRGDEAGATYNFHGDTVELLAVDRGEPNQLVDSTLAGGTEREAHAALDARFVEGVLAGEPPTINTIEEGLAVQRVIDALYRSSEQGSAVRL
jgi:predicted dehydrogenase